MFRNSLCSGLLSTEDKGFEVQGLKNNVECNVSLNSTNEIMSFLHNF